MATGLLNSYTTRPHCNAKHKMDLAVLLMNATVGLSHLVVVHMLLLFFHTCNYNEPTTTTTTTAAAAATTTQYSSLVPLPHAILLLFCTRLTASFLGQPGSAGTSTRKVKPVWI